MKKSKRGLLAWLLLMAALLAGSLLTGHGGKEESIQTAMRDAVLHDVNRVNFFGKAVNPGLISAFTVPAILLVAAALLRIFVSPRFRYVPGKLQLVLEEIVGSIQDEYDQEDEELAPVEGGYLVDGALDLEDVFDAFEMELPPLEEGEEFDTVAGLITERLGRFPEPGEAVTVHWGGLCFAVVKAEERRVVKVKVTKDSPESSAEPSGKSAPEPAQKTN